MSFSSFFNSEWPWFVLIGIMIFVLLILEWIENGHGLKVLSMQDGIRLLNDRRASNFDLRPASEFSKSHISNTKNVSLDDLQKNTDTLIKKKDSPILLICEHNYQAIKAGKALKAKGYSDVHILKGGLATWRKENLPLESTNG